MSAKIVNQYGSIEIDKQVISQVAYRAAMESYGLVGLGYKSKGIVEELEDNTISIELYVILQYGTNISTVANNIIDRVKYTVEKITSINVSKIDINVQGIRVK
nr:Asp23/Gls24 family envelope stress response protein [uncultured Romboutsia sp.]